MNDLELGPIWEWFADTSCKGYSPLYDRICRVVAHDDAVLALVQEAPPPAHQPNVLLGVVHYLLLGGLDHPLAAVYAGESDADPGPLFVDVCLTHRAEVLALMETRRTQTNECGRSAVIGPALTWVAAQYGAPLALLDVGASAGLNLGVRPLPARLRRVRRDRTEGRAGAHRVHRARRRAAHRAHAARDHRAPRARPLTHRPHRREGRALDARVHLARHRSHGAHERRDP